MADDEVDLAVLLVGTEAAILALKIAGEKLHRRNLEGVDDLRRQVGADVALRPSELGQCCRGPQGMEVGRRLEDALVMQVGVQRDMLRVVSGWRRLLLVRLGIWIVHNALPPRLVQDNLHALVGSKVCHPMEIGHHALVPGRNSRLEMLRERRSDR